MTTARDIVLDAARDCGGLGDGETLSDFNAQSALRRFGRLLDAWSLEPNLIYEVKLETLALGANTTSYLTSLLADGRPVSVDSCYIRLANTDFTVEMIDNQLYGAMPVKWATGLPEVCYYNSGQPDGTFFFYPTPYSTMTAYISCRYSLKPSTLTLDTVMAYPVGYEKLFVDALSTDIAMPLFGTQPSPYMLQVAMNTKRLLARNNHQPLEMNINNRERPNIITGP